MKPQGPRNIAEVIELSLMYVEVRVDALALRR